MMLHLRKLLILGFALAAAMPALAADIAAVDPACTFAASAKLGGIADWQDAKIDTDSARWLSGFGEATVGAGCGIFGLQVDTAGFAFNGEHTGNYAPVNNAYEAFQGHLGGALVLRASDNSVFGLSASRISMSQSYDSPDLGTWDRTTQYWRMGAIGNVFISDELALRGSLHYFKDSDHYNFPIPIRHSGIEAEAALKWYATPDLSLEASGAVLRSAFDQAGVENDWNGFALGATAEYLLPEWPASTFAGVRYAKRELDNLFRFDDVQLFAGINFTFGKAHESLAARDRVSPLGNTSIFLEKLPNYAATRVANTGLPH